MPARDAFGKSAQRTHTTLALRVGAAPSTEEREYEGVRIPLSDPPSVQRRAAQRVMVPEATILARPPTQRRSAELDTCTRPSRPIAVPWAAT